jgi:hypothetical protein
MKLKKIMPLPIEPPKPKKVRKPEKLRTSLLERAVNRPGQQKPSDGQGDPGSQGGGVDYLA